MKNLSLFFRATLLLILLTGTALTSAAYDFVSGGIYYNITSSTNMTAAVTYYSKTNNTYSGTVSIPEKVTYDGKTYYVTAIGEYAFIGCTGLKNVNYGSQRITSIGNYAFQGCNGMTSFVIPPQITSIGNGVFNGCYGMTGLTIEESEETLSLGDNGGSEGIFTNRPLTSVFIGRPLSYSTSSNNGYSPFANNKTLVKVHFGNPVKTIQSYIFYGCSSLKTLVYNSQCRPTSISKYAFSGCTSLTESDIHYPESVTSIGEGAFENCTSLQSYTIPNHVTSVGDYAFQYCSRLAHVVIKPSVRSIGNGAFNNCSEMTGLTIEESEETLSLGDNGGSVGIFTNRPLTSVFIGRPLSYSTSSNNGYSPFANNKTLVKVRLGKKLSSIPNYLFYGCTYLDEVTSCATTPPTANSNCFANYEARLYVPINSVNSYSQANVWKNFAYITGVDVGDDDEPIVPGWVIGDVDGDGLVNIYDVTALIDYLLYGHF